MAATSWPEDTLGPASALATVGERLRLATLRFRDPPFQHSRPAKAQLPRRPALRTRQGQCTPGPQVDVGDGVFLALQVQNLALARDLGCRSTWRRCESVCVCALLHTVFEGGAKSGRPNLVPGTWPVSGQLRGQQHNTEPRAQSCWGHTSP